MASQFNHAETAVQRLKTSIGAMSTSAKLMMGGALAVGVGVTMASMFKEPIEQANKYRKIQADILSNGANAKQLGSIQSWAGNDKQNSNLSINEKMAVGAESFALTRDAGRGNTEHTLKLAPILAQIESIAKNSGKEYSEADKANFTKTLEMGGAFNNGADINAMADKYYKLMASGNGTMKNGTLLSILKADPIDINKMSANALGRSEPLMQEMSSGFGVALRFMQNRLQAHVGFGGGTGGKIFAQLKDIGVFGKDDKVIDAGTLTTDYDLWIRKHMNDFYKAAGVKTDADRRHIDYLVGGSSGSKLINRVQSQSDQMDASAAAVAAQHGMKADAANKGGPLDQQLTIVHAQWENILTRIGLKILPTVIRGLTEFSNIMMGVSAWVKNNPGLTKFAALTAMAVSGLLILGGTIAVVMGAFALISWPITLVVAAIIGLEAVGYWLQSINWGAIWSGIKAGFSSFFGWLGNMWSHRPTWMGGDGKGFGTTSDQQTQADRDYYAASGVPANTVKAGSNNNTGGVNVYLDGKLIAAHVTKQIAAGLIRTGRGDSTTSPDYSAGGPNPGNSH